MGVGSFFKKLGKGALKVGKYAAVPALAATGVGIPAAIAVGAAINAADKKASGGSWKDALVSGAVGGATSAIPGGGGVGSALTGGAKAAAGGGIKGALVNAGKNMLVNGGLEAAGKAMGAGAQASAQNRGTQAEIAMDQNQDLENQLLAREREKRAAQSQAYRAAMTGNYASTWKPLARPAGIPGSYQAMDQGGIDSGNELYRQAMLRMKAPDLAGPGAQQGMGKYKDLTQDKEFQKNLKPGFWEKFNGAGSIGLPLLEAALGGARPPQVGQQPPPGKPPVVMTGFPGVDPNKGYMG